MCRTTDIVRLLAHQPQAPSAPATAQPGGAQNPAAATAPASASASATATAASAATATPGRMARDDEALVLTQHSVWEAEQAERLLESNIELIELQAEHAQLVFQLRSDLAQAEEASAELAQEVVTEREQRIRAEEGVVSAMRVIETLEEKLLRLAEELTEAKEAAAEAQEAAAEAQEAAGRTKAENMSLLSQLRSKKTEVDRIVRGGACPRLSTVPSALRWGQ